MIWNIFIKTFRITIYSIAWLNDNIPDNHVSSKDKENSCNINDDGSQE